MMWAAVILVVAGLLLPSSARAKTEETREELGDFSIEDLMGLDLVVTASRFEQHTDEAPASITVVSGEDIRRHGYRSLAEVLNTVRGFYSTYDRNYDYLGTRGFGRPGDYNTRVLILADGHRLNDGVGDAGPIGTELVVDMEDIERIEVIRGPSSSLYGGNAIFGVVNIVTRPLPDHSEAQLGMESRGSDGRRGRFALRVGHASGLRWGISGSGFDDKGGDLYFSEFDEGGSGSGVIRGLDGERFRRLRAQAEWGNFRAQVMASGREKEIPTAPWETMVGVAGNQTWDDYVLATLNHQAGLGRGWSASSQFSYYDYKYSGDYVYDYGEEEVVPAILSDDLHSRRWTGDLKLERRWGANHHLVGGSELNYYSLIEQNTWDDDWVYLEDRRVASSLGLFLQHEYRPIPGVILNAGLRHDRFREFSGETNPRLGVILDPWNRTTVKLLYGRAYRTPTAYELYYHDGGETTKAPDRLDLETIGTFEIEVLQRLATAWTVAASAYRYEIDDLISLIVDPEDELLVFENIDAATTNGVELELRRLALNGIQGRMSYSYQEARDRETDALLSNAPRHLAKVALEVPLGNPEFQAGIDLQYVGERVTPRGGAADASILTNLMLTRTNLGGAIDVGLRVTNLFDSRIEHPASEEHIQDVIIQDGRRVLMSVTASF